MQYGLGSGRIVSAGAGIDCGPEPGMPYHSQCDGRYASGTTGVTITATADAESEFLGWEGDITSPDNPLDLPSIGTALHLRAVFRLRELRPGVPAIMPLPGPPTPDALQRYLDVTITPDAVRVNSPSRFLAALPAVYKYNWLLMTRSESLQTGTAKYPRILIPSEDARYVFSIGLAPHASYPGAHPLAIEYMQWDGADNQKTFRFHEIILADIARMGPYITRTPSVTTYPERNRSITIDDRKCFQCHSTRNVLNETASLGTNGIPPGTVRVKSKPNWDAYDSWGGMTPFNRDRIYQGSLEARAFRKLFNLWNWRGSALNDEIRRIIEQLKLQPDWVMDEMPASPHRIVRNINQFDDTQHIVFGFDGLGALTPTITPPNYAPTSINTTYAFWESPSPGMAILQGGRYVTLRHTKPRQFPTPPIPAHNNDYTAPNLDEGRAVRFFDALGGLVVAPGEPGNFNAQRIADELIHHEFATGSNPIDVRPIAIAICDGLIQISDGAVSSNVLGSPLTIDLSFFDNGHHRILTPDPTVPEVAPPAVPPARSMVDLLLEDTENRTKSIPIRKTQAQKHNLDRQLDTYVRWRPPVRPVVLGEADGLFREYSAPAIPNPDLTQLRQEAFYRPRETFRASTFINGNVFVDREDYDPNTGLVTLFRYFLEPLGVSVDKWSMGVRGRSRAYAFADVFNSGYLPVISSILKASLVAKPVRNRVTNAIVLNVATPSSAQIIDAVNQSLEGIVGMRGINPMPRYTDIQRIFNKACIECHGGLEYPPFSNYTNDMPSSLDLSEDERPGAERLERSYDVILGYSNDLADGTNEFYYRITRPTTSATRTNPTMAEGRRLMPFGGPPLSQADVKAIQRWIEGGGRAGRTYGDPHIKTVSGEDYDFQATGEYVLLRGDFFELQARHTPVSTQAPYGPNAHTGLTSCVSVNTAVAMKIGKHRITYQPGPGGSSAATQMELRLDGQLTNLPADGLAFDRGSRILPIDGGGGIRVQGAGGLSVIITAGYWEHYDSWVLGIQVPFARAEAGLMGRISPGNWLPAMPDGGQLGPRPDGLPARYKILYGVFGPAWQVDDSTSLFDYAPGTSAASFRFPPWPNGESPQQCDAPQQAGGRPPLPPISREAAEKLCTELSDTVLRRHCIEDIMATGEASFATGYRAMDRFARNRRPDAPKLTGPDDQQEGIALPFDLRWDPVADPDGDPITYRVMVWPVHELPDANQAVVIPPANQKDDLFKCMLLAVLIAFVICLILYLILRKKHPKSIWWLALLVLLTALVAYFICGRRSQPTAPLTHRIEGLHNGWDYNWRVIAEDGAGGVTQSETRRFKVKE